ncbi:MAG: sugar nucleotide-binding protein [Rhodospirillales bacterium]
MSSMIRPGVRPTRRTSPAPSARWRRGRRPPCPGGTYHYCGRPALSWFDFANAIAAEKRAITNDATEIRRTTTAAYGAKAPRPAYSDLNCRRIAATLGIEAPDWHPGLARMVEAWMEQHR